MKAVVAETMSPKRTIHASIFPNNLRDKDNILATSPTISIIPINDHTIISNIFPIKLPMLVTLGTIPNPLYPIYFSI